MRKGAFGFPSRRKRSQKKERDGLSCGMAMQGGTRVVKGLTPVPDWS